MTDQPAPPAKPVYCPRHPGEIVDYRPKGAFISFCMRDLAFLHPSEFTPEDLKRLREDIR